MRIDRRKFLLQTAAGVAITSAPETVSAGAASGGSDILKTVLQPDGYRAPDWLAFARVLYFDGYSPPFYPRLSEFDAARFVQCVVDAGANCVRHQPIGYWAYYPSKIFPTHPDLRGRDLIDEVSKECRKAKVHLYCYTGYGHPCFEPGWAEEHGQYADWIMRDIHGNPTGTYWHLGWINRQKTCRLSDPYREAIRTVVRELCDHDTEGVYLDAPSNLGYHGICFCKSCRSNYKKVTGFEIERLANDNDIPAKLAWYDWANQVTAEDLNDFRKIIHGSGKFMLCHNGATWRGTSLPMQYRVPDGFMAEASLQTHERLMHGYMAASMARPYKKLNHMYLGGYNNSHFNQPAHLAPWTTHNSNLEDTGEILLDGYTILAAGGVPMYACLNRLYSKVGSGSIEPLREIFDFMRRHEALLKETAPVAQVAVVPTWESLQTYRNLNVGAVSGRSFNLEMTEGFLLAMLDSHVSADICPSTEVNEAWLARQKVVALCGASGVSAAFAGLLSKWVQAGGGLIATYDTGLYDEGGQIRSDGGGLQELLGVKLRGQRLRAQPDCYYKIVRSHGALGSLQEGEMIQGDNTLIPISVSNDATVLADVYNLGSGETRGPAIVYRKVGRGACIYVSGSLEAHYFSSRVRSLRMLLSGMVRHLANGSPDPFKIESPIGVYGVLKDSADGSRLLWLLAPVGSMDQAAGRMRREPIPVRDVKVSILAPAGKRVRSARFLRSGKAADFRMEGQYVQLSIPELHIAEAIHLEAM